MQEHTPKDQVSAKRPVLPPSEANGYPFFSWAGLKIVDAADGHCRLELQVQHHHRGGGGTEAVNGGIVAYMFDGLLGCAIRSTWDDNVVGQVTVTLNIQYQRMVKARHTVQGEGRVTRRGKAIVFAQGEIYDEAGEVAATCTGIYRLFRRSTNGE